MKALSVSMPIPFGETEEWRNSCRDFCMQQILAHDVSDKWTETPKGRATICKTICADVLTHLSYQSLNSWNSDSE